MNNNYQQGLAELTEFVNAAQVIGLAANDPTDFTSFCTYFMNQSQDLEIAVYSAGRKVITASDEPSSELSQVAYYSSAYAFNVIGTPGRNITFYDDGGASDLFIADDGDDVINCFGCEPTPSGVASGNDVVVIGSGNDTINYGTSDDTYIWGAEAGNATISSVIMNNNQAQNIIQFGAGMTLGSVNIDFNVDSGDLLVTNLTTGSELVVQGNISTFTLMFTNGTSCAGEQFVNDVYAQQLDGLGVDYSWGNNSNLIIGNAALASFQSTLQNDIASDPSQGISELDQFINIMQQTGAISNESLINFCNYFQSEVLNNFVWGADSGDAILNLNINSQYFASYDTVQFGVGLTVNSFNYMINNNNLVIENNSTENTLTITGFQNSSSQTEQFQFADGTSYTLQQLQGLVELTTYNSLDNQNVNGLSGWNNVIYNQGNNDTVMAASPNDTLYGEGNNDILFGGSILYAEGDNDSVFSASENTTLYAEGNNDTLSAGFYSNDTFIWGAGAGNDTIHAYSEDLGNDTLQLGTGLTVDSFNYRISGSDLQIVNIATGETLTISQWFSDSSQQIGTFQFADGTSYTGQQIANLAELYIDGSSQGFYPVNGLNETI